ncbi:hypothetical protein HMI55_006028 [Coelomomyces lativittatus]|nr:hypothetical protein HMI55_006028 [Coelomomyces lativittatus]
MMNTDLSTLLISIHTLESQFLVNEWSIYHNMRFSTSASLPNSPDSSLRSKYLFDVQFWILAKESKEECLTCLHYLNLAFQVLWIEAKELWSTDILTLLFWTSTSLFNVSNQTFESNHSLVKTNFMFMNILRYLSFHWNSNQFEAIIQSITSIIQRKDRKISTLPFLPISFPDVTSNSLFHSDVIVECILLKLDSVFGCPFFLSEYTSQPFPSNHVSFLASLVDELIPLKFIIDRLPFWLDHCTCPVHLLLFASLLSNHPLDNLKPLFFMLLDKLRAGDLHQSHILFMAFLRNYCPSYSQFIDTVINQDKWDFLSKTHQSTSFFEWLKAMLPYEPRSLLDLHLKHIDVTGSARAIYISAYQYHLKDKLGEPLTSNDDAIKEAKLIYSSLERSQSSFPSSTTIAIPTRVHNLLLIKKNWFLEHVLPYLFRYGETNLVHELMSALWNIRKIPSELWQDWMLFKSKQSNALEEENRLRIRHDRAIQNEIANPINVIVSSVWMGYMCLALIHTWHRCEMVHRGVFDPEFQKLEPIPRATQIIWTVLQQIYVHSIDEEMAIKIISNVIRAEGLWIPLFVPHPTPLMKVTSTLFLHPWDCLLWPWLVEPISDKDLTHLDIFAKNFVNAWIRCNKPFHMHDSQETASLSSFHYLVYAKFMLWFHHASLTFPLPLHHPILQILPLQSIPSDLCVYWASDTLLLTLNHPVDQFFEAVLMFEALKPRHVFGLDFSSLPLTLQRWIPFRSQFVLLLDWLELNFRNESSQVSLSDTLMSDISLQLIRLHGNSISDRFVSIFSIRSHPSSLLI